MSGHAHTPHLDAIEHGYAKQAHKNYGVPMPKSDHGHGHGGHGHEEHHDDHGHGHSASGNFSDRLGNAIATPFRGVGTIGYAALDLTKALAVEPVNNVGKISSDSIDDVGKLFQEAGKRGKRYHKALNLPLAGALSGVKAVERACRSVINTGSYAVGNVVKTAVSGLKNAFNTVASIFSSKPMSDFTFDRIKTKPTWKTFDFTKFLLGASSGHGDHGHGSDDHAAHAPAHH